MTVLAIGELVADKLPYAKPQSPNRALGRVMTGALCGAALA